MCAVQRFPTTTVKGARDYRAQTLLSPLAPEDTADNVCPKLEVSGTLTQTWVATDTDK